MKCCPRCKQTKAVAEFARNQSYCRQCRAEYARRSREKNPEKFRLRNREYRKNYPEKRRLTSRRSDLKRNYGLTLAGYNAIRENQNNLCACCGEALKELTAVDHCHRTGVVRGLLCFKCNTGLGHFNDSVDGLQNAIAYLKRFEYLSVLF